MKPITREANSKTTSHDRAAQSVSAAPQLLEEGAAFAELTRRDSAIRTGARDGSPKAEHYDVIVIGGGQAGLSVGYHLARRGIRFVILDAHPRIGDAWRRRWDSLRLFTPARFDGLDGMRFPAPGDTFPTKDEMADYLEAYAERFRLPVRTGTRVDRLTRVADRYVVTAGALRLEAPHMVVAMGTYQDPRTPGFASELDPGIVQIQSRDYRSPSQFPAGGVLVVGGGNSGAEIAFELAKSGRPVWMSGRETGEIPFRMQSLLGHLFIAPILFRIVFHRVLTLDTPLGRRARPAFVTRGGLLIRTRSRDLAAAGVARVPRTEGVRDGKPLLADGRVLDVASVVWCTGFHIGPSWVDLPVFDSHGEPIQARGVVPGEPGLYFVGPHFLYSASSSMIHGVGRDARRVVDVIAARLRVAAAA